MIQNPHNPYNCPRCHSENAQSFQMIYQSGTSTGTYSGVSYGHNVGVIGTGGSSRSQNLLARQLAPPRMRGIGSGAIISAGFGAGLTGLFLLIVSIFIGSYGLPTLAIITLFVAAVAAISVCILILMYFSKITNKQNELIKIEIEKWQHSWMCLKCGNTWYV